MPRPTTPRAAPPRSPWRTDHDAGDPAAHRRLPPSAAAAGARRCRCRPRRAGRPGRRPGRRVGVREVDARQGGDRTRAARPPARSCSTGWTSRRSATGRDRNACGGSRWSSRTRTRRSTRAARSAGRSPMACAAQVGDDRERQRRVASLLEQVGLNGSIADRYPVRVLRRPAPTHRHRPGAGDRSGDHHRRRGGVGPRRLDPGPGRQPARRASPANATPDCCSSPTTSASCATSATRSR